MDETNWGRPIAMKLALMVLALLMCSCGGGGPAPAPIPAPTPTITSVSASCNPESVQAGQTSQCTATVTGTGSYSSAVTWSASAGTISSNGLYTAPGTVPNPATVTVTAQSTEDTTKSGTTTVTVTEPVTITSVSVACSPSTLPVNQTSTCAATVQGTGAYNPAVTWSATDGTITSSGVFTPTSSGTATITATSTQDTTKSGTAQITVSAPATITAPWEISINDGNFLIQANLATNQGAVSVFGPIYWMQALTSGWPSLYPPGTPGVVPGSQWQTMGLTGTVTGDSITMDWFCVSCGLPGPWNWNLTGTIDTTNKTVSGDVSGEGTGTFSGAEVTTALPAKYSGTMAIFSNSCIVSPGTTNCPSQGNDTVEASLVVDGNFNATATLVLSGVDNGTFILSGPLVGKTIQLSGMVSSQDVEFVAYYDVEGVYGGIPQSLIVFQTPYPTSTKNGTYGYNGTLNPIN